MVRILSVEKRINERIKPSLCSWGFLALYAILRDLKLFSKLAEKENANFF